MTDEERLIRDMEVGESGWTMPWGIHRGLGDDFYIDPLFNLYNDQEGTSQVLVTRKDDGYYAILHTPHRYEHNSSLPERLISLISFERPI